MFYDKQATTIPGDFRRGLQAGRSIGDHATAFEFFSDEDSIDYDN